MRIALALLGLWFLGSIPASLFVGWFIQASHGNEQ